MRITDKTQRKVVDFNELEVGDIFKDDDGVYVKICDYGLYDSNDDENAEKFNTFCFTTNRVEYFHMQERVEKLQAELILNTTIT